MEIKNTLESTLFALKMESYSALKTRGPYQHRYDLPGGSQQLGEGLT